MSSISHLVTSLFFPSSSWAGSVLWRDAAAMWSIGITLFSLARRGLLYSNGRAGEELLIHCSCSNNPITSSSPFLPKTPLSTSRPAWAPACFCFPAPWGCDNIRSMFLGHCFNSGQGPPFAVSKPTPQSTHPALQLHLTRVSWAQIQWLNAGCVYGHVQGGFAGESYLGADLSKSSWD